MQELDLIVDYNGIVLFGPDLLKEFYGGKIAIGTDLYKRFTKTDEGDALVERGVIIPILNISDSIYKIYIRYESEPSSVDHLIVTENGIYPLHVCDRLVVADLAVIADWAEAEGWHAINVNSGYYSVIVRGFRKIERKTITDFGYEFVLKPVESLPKLSASINKDIQVLKLPGKK
jgi:hypothetical protein